MREPKTDNMMTKSVLEALEVMKGVKKEIKEMSTVPFLKRQLTRYEKSKRRF